jgi:hypothetical protein
VNTCRIPRVFSFEQKATGANVQFQSDFSGRAGGDSLAAHRLIYGIDYSHTATQSFMVRMAAR